MEPRMSILLKWSPATPKLLSVYTAKDKPKLNKNLPLDHLKGKNRLFYGNLCWRGSWKIFETIANKFTTFWYCFSLITIFFFGNFIHCHVSRMVNSHEKNYNNLKGHCRIANFKNVRGYWKNVKRWGFQLHEHISF